jgi:hypothetical protein
MNNPEDGSASQEQEPRVEAKVYTTLMSLESQLADLRALLEKAGTNDAEREMLSTALKNVVALENRYMNK